MTNPWAGLDALGGARPGPDPFSGLDALGGSSGWESVSPVLQRRRKADGSWEYRPAPKEGGLKAVTPADTPGFVESYLDTVGETYRGVPARIKEGIAAIPELAVSGVNLLVPSSPQGRLQADPGDIYGERGGIVRETRESVREGYGDAQDRLSDAARGLPPIMAGAAEVSSEVAASVADPTNWVGAGGAAKAAGKQLGRRTVGEVAEAGIRGLERGLAHADEFLAKSDDAIERLANRLNPPPPMPGRQVALADGNTLNVPHWYGPEEIEAAIPPPPRLPLDDLPDPAQLPRHEFEALADLPPEVSGAIHREAVEQAVNAGERVRPTVLEGYPDLSAKITVAGRLPGETEGAPLTASARSLRLSYFGNGEPGFAVGPPEFHIGGRVYANERAGVTQKAAVYRGPSGEPVSAAVISSTDGGKTWLVEDLVARPPKSLLDGRAAASVKKFLGEHNATASSGSITPDAVRARAKLGSRPDIPVALPLNAEAGFVRVPNGPGLLSRYFRKDGEFAALGDLRGWSFERAGQMQREIAAGKRRVQDTIRDFSSAFEDEVVANGLSPGDSMDNVTAYIEGRNDGTGLSPRLRSAADEMRAHYDDNAEGYLTYADLPGSLRETIELNRGSYHPRIFEGFENPDWPRIVDPTSPRHDPRERWRWDNYMTWAQDQRTVDQAALYPMARVSVGGQEGRVVRVGASAREAMEAARGQMPPPAALPEVPPATPGLRGPERQVENVQRWQAGNERAAARQEATAQRRGLRRQLFDQELEARRNDVLVETGTWTTPWEFTPEIDDATGDVLRQILPREQVQATRGMAAWGDDQLAAYGQRLLDKDPDAFFGVGQSEVGREGRGNLKRRIIQDPRAGDLPTDLAERVRNGQVSMPTAIEQAKQRPGWFAQYVQHAPGLPEELDDLLGLYRDPSQRYRTGAMRAVHDQAVYRMHSDLAEQGLGTIFFTEDTMGPGFYEKIGGKGPLAELVTTPEIAAVIRGTENTSQQAGKLLEAWRKVNGGVKLAKTALNFPAGHMRNAAAWPFQLMAGGHFGAAFNPARPLQLLPYQLADKLGPKRGVMARMAKRLADTVELADGSRLGERWAMSLDELRPEIRYLYEQGVFGESAAGADIRHYAGAFPTLREPGAIDATRRALKAPIEAGINFWAGGDDLGKHVYYRAELQNLLWADGQMGALESLPADYFTRPEFAEAATEAARRTRLTTPTGSQIPPGIRAMRDLPVGPFPGWTSEVFRNAKEQVKLGLADLRHANPKRKVLGAKRLSGFLAMSALAGGGLAAGVNKISGVKDPEGVRSFVPPWSRDSQLAVLNVDPRKGTVRYVDASSLLPYSAFMDSAGVLLRSIQDPTDSSWDATLDTVQASLQPYIEEDIIANAVLDFARNRQGGESALTVPFQMARENERRESSYPIRTPGASSVTQAKQAAYFWWKSLAPSGLVGLQGERLARAATEDNPEVRKLFVEMTNYDRDLEIKDEGVAALGLRVSTTDVSKSISRLGSDYVRQRADAHSMYTRRSRMGAEGVAHPEVTLAAKEESNQMGRSAHEQAARVLADAFRLGFNEQQVRLWLKEGNIAKKHREALLRDAHLLVAGQEPQWYLPVVD